MNSIFIKNNKGQSLVEILIAVSLGAIIVGGAAALFNVSFRSSTDTKKTQTVSALAQELTDEIRSISETDWTQLYSKAHDGTQYYTLNNSIATGTETVTIDNKTYKRFFTVDYTNRQKCGSGIITTSTANSTLCDPNITDPSVIAEDPSTQKITITILWDHDQQNYIQSLYIPRIRSATFKQMDWSGGNNQESFPTSASSTIINNKFSTYSNIDYSTAKVIKNSSSAANGTLTSSIFDTFIPNGSSLNIVSWTGTQPAGTSVRFQFASSNNSGGPWTYYGPDGTGSTYYTISTGQQNKINMQMHKNNRYFRYKVDLIPSSGNVPQINSIIINYLQ